MNLLEQDITFDFENELQQEADQPDQAKPVLPVGEIGQQPKNYIRNFKKTVCIFWIKGMCMKGDNCGFLHEMIPDRMPECTTFLKKGLCDDPNCPFKHSKDGILECNMYALGFCIYGPECRYKHTRKPGPPPDPSTVEAAKPKAFRDINRVVNSVNKNVVNEGTLKRTRMAANGPGRAGVMQLQGPRPPTPPPMQSVASSGVEGLDGPFPGQPMGPVPPRNFGKFQGGMPGRPPFPGRGPNNMQPGMMGPGRGGFGPDMGVGPMFGGRQPGIPFRPGMNFPPF